MNLVVYLNEARVHTLSAGPDKSGNIQQVRLRPGRNVVDKALFDIVKKDNDAFEQLVDTGLLTVHGDRLDITSVDAKKAITLIELETTPEGVQELLAQEEDSDKPRKNVVAAAKAKIAAISEAAANDKEVATKASVKAKGAEAGASVN